MGRSFGSPDPREVLEVWRAARVDHPPSHQRFELVWRGGRLLFRREPLGRDAAVLPAFEQPVDGGRRGSGHRARTYLYRTPGGELATSCRSPGTPRQGCFGMAPGYDRPDHEGVLRRVRRECLFVPQRSPGRARGQRRRTGPSRVSGGAAPRHRVPALPRARGGSRAGRALGRRRGRAARHHRQPRGAPAGGSPRRGLLPVPPAAGRGAARAAPPGSGRLLVPARRAPAAYQAHLDVAEAGRLRTRGASRSTTTPIACARAPASSARPAGSVPVLPRSARAPRARRATRARPACLPGLPLRPGPAGVRMRKRPLGDEQADWRRLPHAGAPPARRRPRDHDRPPHPARAGRARVAGPARRGGPGAGRGRAAGA